MARIGVEQSLTNVQQALREKGHDIVELRQESDAMVVIAVSQLDSIQTLWVCIIQLHKLPLLRRTVCQRMKFVSK